MSSREDVRAFLISRRAQISPAQAGLTVSSAEERRVPGAIATALQLRDVEREPDTSNASQEPRRKEKP